MHLFILSIPLRPLSLPRLLLKLLFLLQFCLSCDLLFPFLLKFCKFSFLFKLLFFLSLGNDLRTYVLSEMVLLIHKLDITLTLGALLSL